MRGEAATHQAMLELRAFLEDAIAEPDEAQRNAILASARRYVETHCSSCGDLLDGAIRRREAANARAGVDPLCIECLTPPGNLRSRPPQPTHRAEPVFEDGDVPF